MPSVTIDSASNDTDAPHTITNTSVEGLLSDLEDEYQSQAVDDVEVIDDDDVWSDGESGFVGFKYESELTGEEMHIELMILRGGEDDTPQVFPFDFAP